MQTSQKSADKQGGILCRLLLGIVIVGIVSPILLAQAPQWWAQRGITNGNAANDYAAVNQGQVKNIAVAAVAELDANLPGGAGNALHTLAANLSGTTAATNDYAAVNLGQIKYLSKPFFDRLLAVGYQGHPLESGTYPWLNSSSVANDYAMTNIGQVKNLFSFNVSSKTDPTNPLSDWWQMRYFGHLGIDPNADPDGDIVTNLQEYQRNTDPSQALDTNNNGMPDDWEILHANSFSVWPPSVTANLSIHQSGTQVLFLNNSTPQPVQYTISLTGNVLERYAFTNSRSGNISFAWEDISASGTQLTGEATFDDGAEVINLSGFTIPFYGQNYSSVYVCSNGFLTFGAASVRFENTVLPSVDAPENLIAPLWKDLNPSQGGAIYYKQETERLIVQYQDIPSYSGNGIYTFQIVLSSDGTIEYRYKDISDGAINCTVGIQNADGTAGTQIAYGEAYLENNMAIRISPVATYVNVTPLSGTIASGSAAQLSAVFNALNISPGSYTANIHVVADSGTTALNIPAVLNIINPQVTITQPVTGDLFELHSTVPITAEVIDFNAGHLTFYMQAGDGSSSEWLPIGTGTAAPYKTAIDYIGFGDYSIKAEYQTKDGRYISSNVVTIHVQERDSSQNGIKNGIPDAWEQRYFGYIGVSSSADFDGDGVSNFDEYWYGSDPTKSDTDGDGIPDYDEIAMGGWPSGSSSPKVDAVAIKVGISDADFYDDVWGVQMQISDENGEFTGSPQDVVDNQGNVNDTSWAIAYIPIGHSAKFTLKRIEAGQGRYSDEYKIHFEPVAGASVMLEADSNNSPLEKILPWQGEGGSIPPDPSGLQWIFYQNVAASPSPSGGRDTIAPIDEATGSRYRKVALNGRPMSDSRPQHEEETDEQKEETYVDAMTLALRHSTTDIYIPIPGSTLALSVRRNVTSENWNAASGLRPAERFDRPFGACWTSNLSPIVEYVTSTTAPATFYVTDETGTQHRFLYVSTGSNAPIFCPVPTSNLESPSESGTLKWSGQGLEYTGKHGTVITFERAGIYHWYYADRKNQMDLEGHSYYRATSVVDRVNSRVSYSYSAPGAVIPSQIKSASKPSQFITITTEQSPAPYSYFGNQFYGSVVKSISDPNGNTWNFTYTTASVSNEDGGTVAVLSDVARPDGNIVSYTYSHEVEEDSRSWLGNNDKVQKLHCDLASIATKSGGTQIQRYDFAYLLDSSKQDHSDTHGYYQKTGIPRNIYTVTLPDGNVSSFVNNSYVCVELGSGTSISMVNGSLRQTVVTDAVGSVTQYDFTDPYPVEAKLEEVLGYAESSRPITIYYRGMTISYPYGVEQYTFDISASMALSSVLDMSGNYTEYRHDETIHYPTGISPLQQVFQSQYSLAKYYDDPSSQLSAAGTKSFVYGPWRIMCESIDEAGRYTINTVDATGRRLDETVHDASGNVIKETLFGYGNSSYPGVVTAKVVKSHATDPSWATDIATSYTLTAAGTIASETTYANGQALTKTYTYDSNNNKLSATDENGNTTTFAYDALNRLVKATYANGVEKSFVYDAAGNKISESDENGHITNMVYDRLNRLIETHKEMGGGAADLVTRFEYNAVNSKTKTTDPNGNATVTEYDQIQRPIQVTAPATMVGGVSVSGVTTMTYGTNSGASVFDTSTFKPTIVIDPNSTVTEVVYDNLYRPVTHTVTYASQRQSITTTAYDAVGNPITTVDPVGNVANTEYDALNRPVKTSYVGATGTASTMTAYTSTGLKWKVTDELGNATETRYDSAGRPVKVLAPAVSGTCATTETAYDNAGNAVAVTNPLGNVTHFGYDARNRRIWELAPPVQDATLSGTVMIRPLKQTAYDGVGNIVSVVDHQTGSIDGNGNLTVSGSGAETATVYDAANRPVTVRKPEVADPLDGNTPKRPTAITAYDANGNVLSVTDPNSHTTVNTYDALNRLTSTTDAAGITVSYEYDLVGNRTKVTDGKGNATAFTYDGLKRNTSVVDAAGRTTAFLYDGINKIQRTDARGRVTQYGYDYRNRLTSVIYTGQPSDNRTYGYDAAGNLLAVSEPGKNGAADVAYTYDALKRVVTETSNGITHTYSYDLAGNRLQTVYGGNSRTLVSTYDALNRLSTLSENGRLTGYGYDTVGNIVVKSAPNGDQETATFDLLNRTMSQTATSGTVTLYQYTYAHDLAGNVTQVGENYSTGLNNRVVNNTYDANNRLVTEAVSGSNAVTTAYGYDAANNRTSKVVTGGSNGGTTAYTYNALNQLTQYSDSTRTVTLGYDLAGNRVTRTVSGNGGTDTYGYDFENRLVHLVKGTESGTGTYDYVYDYRTRRVVRDETQAGGVRTKVVFSGGTSVMEYVGESTYPAVEYIRGSDYGGGVGGILYTLRGGEASFTHENRRGDVIAKTNASGALTYQASYEAFGTRTQEQGSTQDRQKANTKDEDPTGLLNEGFRYRDLEAGVFITADPLGFVDGPNLYTYVKQNPWTMFDPEGLAAADYAELQRLNEGTAAEFVNDAAASAGKAQQGVNTTISTVARVAESAAELHPAVAATEAATGKSPTGDKTLSSGERLLAAAMVVPAGKLVEGATKLLKEGVGALKMGKVAGEAGKIEKSTSTILKDTEKVTNDIVSKPQTGSYTIEFESGKKYHGKGPETRAEVSAKRESTVNSDPAKQIEWKPAESDREAFKAEAKRISNDGGVKNPNNYNRIESPGKKYIKQDDK